MKQRRHQLCIAAQARLYDGSQGREDQRGMQVLLVEEGDAPIARTPLRGRADRLPGQFTQTQTFPVFRAVIFFVRARCRDYRKSWIWNVLGDLASNDELAAFAVVIDKVEILLVLLGKMPEKSFFGLVEMVVCVVDAKVQ